MFVLYLCEYYVLCDSTEEFNILNLTKHKMYSEIIWKSIINLNFKYEYY